MYTLRDYQKEASDAGVDYFLNDKKKSKASSGVIVAPTGAGKSIIIADIANRLEGNTLVFQPRKELLVQNYEKYVSYGNIAYVYSASLNKKEVGKVTFATIGSVIDGSGNIKEPEKFKHFKYCLIDECHLLPPRESSLYQQFLSQLGLKVLGLTATPIRTKQYNFPYRHSKLNMLDRMRPRAFGRYVHITQIQELVKRGYFAKTEYQQVSFDRSKLEINSTGGDFTEESMTFALQEQNTNDKVIESIKHLLKAGRKHIAVFTPSVAEAQYIATKGKGRVVHANTKKKERDEILRQFKSGEIPFVANVGILGIGFDFPALDTILIARPTMSLAVFYQMVGRGVRPHYDKDKCLIIDFVGNIDKFGKVEDLEIRQGDHGWGIYANGVLLTNRDIADESKKYTERKVKKDKGEIELRFGKHKGKKIKEIPEDYLWWAWKNVDSRSWTQDLLNYIKETKKFLKEDRLADKKQEVS